MEDGTVQIPGVSWECMSTIDNAPDRFIASATGDVDVGENGIRRLSLDHLSGAAPTAIPVFFGREHMQRNLIVRKDSPLHHPKDLAGKVVGSRLTIISGTSAAVLMMLEQAYGLQLGEVEWHLGDPKNLPVNRMNLRLGTGAPTDEVNFQRLLKGDLDAVIVTTGPRYWSLYGGDKVDEALEAYSEARPLITDPSLIAETYRKSGLYPITDTVVVSPRLLDEHPDLPPKLVQAFARANAMASRYRGPEEEAIAKQEIELLGEDPHQYGLAPNRKNLAAFLDFLYRLGALERSIPPEDLFVPSARS